MIDDFIRIADRFGIPTAILVLVGLIALAVVKGPLTRFAEVLAAPVAQLVRSHIAFVSTATARLEALPGQVALEAEKTRGHVTAQVAGAVTELRDRVSDAERAVTATGQHPAVRLSQIPEAAPSVGGTPAAASPTSSSTAAAPITQPDRPPPPRQPMGTLPSASEASPVRA